MYCEAVDGFFLKANGEIPCWCSPGEDQPLFRMGNDTSMDAVLDVLNSPTMRGMRKTLYNNGRPFEYCRGCGILKRSEPDSWNNVDCETFEIRSLRMFQVESSYLCNIDCPLCVRRHVRKKTKKPPYFLSFERLKNTVDDLVRHNIGVQQTCFSGRGDPFMAPDLSKMVRYVKDKLGCVVNAQTNGNFRFQDAYATCGFDAIDFSLDGVTQEKYARYRRSGNLKMATQFASDFARAKRKLGNNTPKLGWKMVLFEWNSTDQDIQRAVEWSEEIGMDHIIFVDTDTPGGVSYRGDVKRVQKIKALISKLRSKAGIPIILDEYASVYSKLPEVEIKMRISFEGQQTILQGRLFNHLLEDKSVHVHTDLMDESGLPPLRLYDEELHLPERSEVIGSIEIPAGDWESGRVKTVVSDLETGIGISEAMTPITRLNPLKAESGP